MGLLLSGLVASFHLCIIFKNCDACYRFTQKLNGTKKPDKCCQAFFISFICRPIPKTLAGCNRLFCSLAALEKRQNILKYAAIFLPCQPAKLLDFGDAHVFGIGSKFAMSVFIALAEQVIAAAAQASFRYAFRPQHQHDRDCIFTGFPVIV